MNEIRTTPIQKQIVDTLEAMALEQGYRSVRAWYDHDSSMLRMQLAISEETFMDRVNLARRMPQVPIDELVRRLIARQMGKGLRRYGRRK